MTAPLSPIRSERGVALIIVLLLLAVISAMATGLTVNSQTEIAMATNEAYYAGARAAAEAGMNRASEKIILDTTHDMLKGQDDTSGTADDGLVDYLLAPDAPPYALGDTGEYTYTIRIYDDDDPALYGGDVLSDPQLLAMGVGATPEDGTGTTDVNDRMILQVTGFGPKGTRVTIARILENDFDQDVTPNTISSNPALLVNGDLVLDGNMHILGSQGNVHANGDLDKTGVAGDVSGDMTASGTLTSNAGFTAGGTKTGGAHTINVPDITAAAHEDRAQYKLTLVAGVPFKQATALAPGGATAAIPCGGSCDGFTWNAGAGRWDSSSGDAGTGTYYIEGAVKFSATGGAATYKEVTVIATGSIEVDGRNFLKPSPFEQDSAGGGKYLQFVTDGDLKITGNSTLDDATAVEGQSLVREQIHMFGTPSLQGRILVQDVESVSDLVTTNYVGGTPTITYNGSLGPIVTDAPIYGPITYTNNISGWMESQ